MKESVGVTSGRPNAAKRCEKKGHHLWQPAHAFMDPIKQVPRVRKVKMGDPKHTHRACSRCGLLKEK